MRITQRVAVQVGVAALALSMMACGSKDTENEKPKTLTVQIHSTEDLSQPLGSVTFMEDSPSGLVARFDIKANDVLPPGSRAIHIHQNPNCDPAPTEEGGEPVPGGGAGGHFNPLHVGHGEQHGPHVGDSDAYNYTFNADGSFSGTVRFSQASFTGETSVLRDGGTSLIIHSGTDDMRSDPAGNAGPRAACGIIAEE